MTQKYGGLPYESLRSPFLELDYLTTAGPRLAGLYATGSSENILAEVPDLVEKTSLGDYRFLGGHRLWHAPEGHPRSYVPDDQGLDVEEADSGVWLHGPIEAATGVQKSIHVALTPDSPVVVIQHTITNHGLWPIELAAWAITQLPPGGLAILPQPTAPADKAGLLPNRRLVLWPYTRWSDQRLQLDDAYIFVDGIPSLPPLKLGYTNTAGWMAYFRNGLLFCKRTQIQPSEQYPDFGANAECFCNDRFLELETLSPLTRLDPGATVQHQESWEITPMNIQPPTRNDLIQAVERLNFR